MLVVIISQKTPQAVTLKMSLYTFKKWHFVVVTYTCKLYVPDDLAKTGKGGSLVAKR